MCGSSSNQTSTSTSSSSPPAQVQAEYQGLVDRATNVANIPYQAYPGELVAPLTGQTQTGLGQVGQYAQAAQPYYNTAGNYVSGGYGSAQLGSSVLPNYLSNPYQGQSAGMYGQSSQAVNPMSYSGQAIGQFMNPFTASVVGATQAELANQNAQQAQFLNSQNIGAGAFGGDRAGVAQSVLANQQQLAQAPTIANLNQQNYEQALAEFNNQQQTQLGAGQFNRQQMLQAAQGLGNLGAQGAQLGQQGSVDLGTLGGQMSNIGATYGGLGTAAQTAGIQGAMANIQGGMIPQNEQQSIDTALSQLYAQGQAYPFQTTGFLGNIVEGIGSQQGGTGTSQTTAPGPSTTSQIVGGASAGMGLLGNLFNLSDERAKKDMEPIGETFDGQPIYRFEYRGGHGGAQLGLSAQETEHRHPEAVARGPGGLRYVDYDAATETSARRGSFQFGGGTPSMAATPMPRQGSGFSPQAALAMSGVQGAQVMTPQTRQGEAELYYAPGGQLFSHGQQQAAPTLSGYSPLSPMPQGNVRRAPVQMAADGGVIGLGRRVGLQYGGMPGPALNTGYVDFSVPEAMSMGYMPWGSINGVPQGLTVSPTAGLSNIEYSSAAGGYGGETGAMTGMDSIGSSAFGTQGPTIGSGMSNVAYRPINWQMPARDYQTAAAELSATQAGITKAPQTQTGAAYGGRIGRQSGGGLGGLGGAGLGMAGLGALATRRRRGFDAGGSSGGDGGGGGGDGSGGSGDGTGGGSGTGGMGGDPGSGGSTGVGGDGGTGSGGGSASGQGGIGSDAAASSNAAANAAAANATAATSDSTAAPAPSPSDPGQNPAATGPMGIAGMMGSLGPATNPGTNDAAANDPSSQSVATNPGIHAAVNAAADAPGYGVAPADANANALGVASTLGSNMGVNSNANPGEPAGMNAAPVGSVTTSALGPPGPPSQASVNAAVNAAMPGVLGLGGLGDASPATMATSNQGFNNALGGIMGSPGAPASVAATPGTSDSAATDPSVHAAVNAAVAAQNADNTSAVSNPAVHAAVAAALGQNTAAPPAPSTMPSAQTSPTAPTAPANALGFPSLGVNSLGQGVDSPPGNSAAVAGRLGTGTPSVASQTAAPATQTTQTTQSVMSPAQTQTLANQMSQVAQTYANMGYPPAQVAAMIAAMPHTLAQSQALARAGITGGQTTVTSNTASAGRAGGGRVGLQNGGSPFTTVQYDVPGSGGRGGRNAPTYTAGNFAGMFHPATPADPPAVAVARHLASGRPVSIGRTVQRNPHTGVVHDVGPPAVHLMPHPFNVTPPHEPIAPPSGAPAGKPAIGSPMPLPALGSRDDFKAGMPLPNLGSRADFNAGMPLPALGSRSDFNAGTPMPALGSRSDFNAGMPLPALGSRSDFDQGAIPPQVSGRAEGGRIGYQSGGVLGQMPMAGAIGYTPQAQGVTGMGPGGSSMGSGATASDAAGFGSMFGGGQPRQGFDSGGNVNRQGLAGFGDFSVPQIYIPNEFQGVNLAPLQAGGRGAPQPGQAPNPNAGQGSGGGSGSSSDNFSNLAKSAGPLVKQAGKLLGLQGSSSLPVSDASLSPQFTDAATQSFNDPMWNTATIPGDPTATPPSSYRGGRIGHRRGGSVPRSVQTALALRGRRLAG